MDLSALTNLLDLGAFALPPDWLHKALVTREALDRSNVVPKLYEAGKSAARPRVDRGPEHFFGQHEVEIESVDRLLREIAKVQVKHRELDLIWRGHQRADWALDSNLYRQLTASGTMDEDAMVAFEREALERAVEWDIDLRTALRFFAELQHHGAPTRFIDISLDALVATWFAVEQHDEHDQHDARLLAVARRSAGRGGDPARPRRSTRGHRADAVLAQLADETTAH